MLRIPALAALLFTLQLVSGCGSPETAARPEIAARPHRALKGHRGPVFQVTFSPDGRWLASSGYGPAVNLRRLD